VGCKWSLVQIQSPRPSRPQKSQRFLGPHLWSQSHFRGLATRWRQDAASVGGDHYRADGLRIEPEHCSEVLHAWLVPMVIINTLVNIRGMSQHTRLAEPAHAIRGSRTILAGPVVRFFMCNENFHLEHHLLPRVPWYHLPELHERLAPQLMAERAPFIPSYFSFVRDFVRTASRA
jgi:hypothetical protein